MIRLEWVVVLAAGIALSQPAAAKLYKWVDDQGVTHYGETVPPEYADKTRSELDKSGRVIKKKETLTPEAQRAKEEEEARKREEEEAAREQKRYDKALVNTYSSVKEIELARKRNLQQVDARVNSIDSQIKMLQTNLAELQKEADGYAKAGKKMPGSLRDDLDMSQKRLAKLQQDLEKANAEKAALDARYDADKARYKELTGK
jgi:chromosome segregation ATPase